MWDPVSRRDVFLMMAGLARGEGGGQEPVEKVLVIIQKRNEGRRRKGRLEAVLIIFKNAF